ncbi:MAG TPA: hypothetical protein VLJ16_09900, partial [Acidobacteriota bacterium]|nr:hypothetical protein [Acidobacteriota bacterium]
MDLARKLLFSSLAVAFLFGAACGPGVVKKPVDPRTPPAPLYRDPVFDGAADPSLIWNDKERTWWIFYTNRRANAPDAQDGVRWCHGTDIGIASSADGGLTWTYRGPAKGLEFEPGRNTFWAPCLAEHGRTFHMFVAYVRGVPADWSGDRHIVHYTSRDLVDWKCEGIIPLSSERVIDAFVYARPAGGWRMWYKDEANGSHIYAADSEDLFRWSVAGPVIAEKAQEGAAVFWWRGSYWMLVDRWQGMGVLRSPDLATWTEQPGTILGGPGRRRDDGDIGRHGEVVVQGPNAYLFYFTHPYGPKAHTEPGKHRSSIQVARLELRDGLLTCDRDKPFPLELVPPSGFKPARRSESPLGLETPDAKLAAAFTWAKGQALDYVFPAAVHGDPVGDWYEAALPSRFAFCMRDVSHQATGAHVLGLAAFNRNMLRKFAGAVSPSRDFCSYWEIDKWDRPAPVDYKSDKDFWYNLTANFDVLDACWRQFLWTGDPAYVQEPAFLDFYRLTLEDYIEAWDKDGDGIPEHHPEYGYRGLGGYDEGPFSDRGLYGSDLISAMARAFGSYAGILRVRGEKGTGLLARAAALKAAYDRDWWSDTKGKYADGRVQGGALVFQDVIWNGVFPLYFGFIPAGPRRDATLRRIVEAEPEGIEIESYLPEVLYRFGLEEAAYARILALTDPGKERREYPEVPFAVVGAVAAGLMGIEPDAAARTIRTRSGLTDATPWAEIRNVPVFDGVIDVRHDGRSRTTLGARSDGEFIWR